MGFKAALDDLRLRQRPVAFAAGLIYSDGMKDDHGKKLWFKRRRYGWGYVPVTWQGGLCLIVFLAVLFAAVLQLPRDKSVQPTTGQLIVFLVVALVDVVLFAAIMIIKGPVPHWRWGKKPGDNPEEDF